MFKDYREKNGLLWRVGPICTVLSKQYGVNISRSGYYGSKKRPQSARDIRDEHLKEKILELWDANYSCWGAKKTWHELDRQDILAARCTVERLMRSLGLRGVLIAKVKRTTIASKNARNAEDLIKRNFWAQIPNKTWVADFTYVSTWEGWCYTAFVTDVFARRIIGWSVSSRMNEKLVADAFKMAVFTRQNEGRADFSDLTHHNDKGSQYTADRFFELLALHGIKASIGSVGDSYDNALAESINGGYKAELIRNPNKKIVWRSLEQLKLETARWVHWHNTGNITEYNDWHTPVEIEEMLYTDGIDARKGSKMVEA
jgi:putative transposase